MDKIKEKLVQAKPFVPQTVGEMRDGDEGFVNPTFMGLPLFSSKLRAWKIAPLYPNVASWDKDIARIQRKDGKYSIRFENYQGKPLKLDHWMGRLLDTLTLFYFSNCVPIAAVYVDDEQVA